MIPHENEANFEFGQNKLLESGTSPHAWGLWRKIRIGERISWFIPTCVGFMSWPLVLAFFICGTSPRAWGLFHTEISSSRCLPVHPHVRGVYETSLSSTNCASGSSPRAWGLYIQGGRPHGPRRFIPTCVGFIFPTPSPFPQETVHPHVRGVYDI